ncbi:hypothetical protein I317_00867 [Kwoniella heveanensis CBS 569]|nr:hypothetical protein I317_00867 [Kwoniella heveanensis CBS 569]
MSNNNSTPKVHRIKVAMNGVTGRMGTNQHLIRSIIAIRKQGGVVCSDGDKIIPEPILIGRNRPKLEDLATDHSLDINSCVSTDLDAVLADPEVVIYFDAQTTGRRADAVKKAIAAGKHVYCEKPTAVSTEEAYDLYETAKKAGVKNGVVQDKLWLPGLVKLKTLIDSGFFGKILSVKGDFGYWVFTGLTPIAPQRPSWNYRKEDDGGIIVDMLCHWRYVIHNLFGPIKTFTCLGATHIPERVDEQGKKYKCTADDAAYATFELENGVIVHFNSSWTTRPRRDDLLTIQVDGSEGSAVATLRDCVVQHASATPRPTWNPDVPATIDHFAAWTRVPDWQVCDNAFKVQWEMFLRHVVKDEPWRYDLLEGARGVQLTELGLKSWEERRWVDVPELKSL